ncbi:MAG: Na-translocating system protein MpsC family protein [Cyanobacteria bacterium J06627_28]
MLTSGGRISKRQALKQLTAIEKELEEKIRELYSDFVGHDVSAVNCKFLESADLYVSIEGSASLPEKFLEEWGSTKLAEDMRNAIDQIIRNKLGETLENDLNLQTNQISLLKPKQPEQIDILIDFSV